LQRKARAKSAVNLLGAKDERKSSPSELIRDTSTHTKDKRNQDHNNAYNNLSKTMGETGATVVAKKMTVEKQNKRLRPPVTKVLTSSSNKVKTLNIMNTTDSHATQAQQRVIKIDLNNMSWEETFPTSNYTTIFQADEESHSDSSDYAKEPHNLSSHYKALPDQTNHHSSQPTTDEFLKHKTTTLGPNVDYDKKPIEQKASDACNFYAGSHREQDRTIRKTVSFDDHLIPDYENCSRGIMDGDKQQTGKAF